MVKADAEGRDDLHAFRQGIDGGGVHPIPGSAKDAGCTTGLGAGGDLRAVAAPKCVFWVQPGVEDFGEPRLNGLGQFTGDENDWLGHGGFVLRVFERAAPWPGLARLARGRVRGQGRGLILSWRDGSWIWV